MKDKNRQFEETGAFLDVMSKRERRRWEKEQAKLKKKEKENFEEEMLEESVEEEAVEVPTNVENKIEETKEMVEPIGVTVSSEELELELEKTKEIMALTDEIPTKKIKQTKKEIIEEDEYEEDDEITFNPVPLIGMVLIVVIAFLVYIILASKYDNSTFLIVNSAITILFTFFFGLTALSNQRHVKVFAILDLLIILGIVVFNGVSIVNYDNIYNKVEQSDKKKEEIDEPDKPIIEDDKEDTPKEIINEYSCTDADEIITVLVTEKDGYITNIKRNDTLKDEEVANEINEFYKDTNGISVELNEATLEIDIDLSTVDIEQYKEVIEKHNEYYRLDSDFSYIENNKLSFDKYNEIELKNLTCTKKENN